MAKLLTSLLAVLMVSSAMSASFTVGSGWAGSDAVQFSEVVISSANDNFVMLNNFSGTRAATLTTWTSSGIGDEYTFNIEPEDYTDCTSLTAGFLTDATVKSYYYLVWTCAPSSNKDIVHYFFAQMQADGTVKNQAILSPSENVYTTDFTVAFMQTTIVAQVNNGKNVVLLGLDDSLTVSFEMSIPAEVSVSAVTDIEDSDTFAVLGSGTTTGQFYLGTFDNKGTKKLETYFTFSGINPTTEGIAASSSGILVLLQTNDTVYTTLFKLSDLTPVDSKKLSIDNKGTYYPLADGTSFAIAYGSNTTKYAAWLFDDTFAQKSSFSTSGVNGYTLPNPGRATFAESKYVIFAGSFLDGREQYFGAWAFSFDGKDSDFKTPAAFPKGTNPTLSNAKLIWAISDKLSSGTLAASKETFAKKLDAKFHKLESGSGAKMFSAVAVFAFFSALLF